MEWLQEFISSNSTVIFSVLLTFCLSYFAKVTIRIFRFGTEYRTQLTSKEEFDTFKKEIRTELRSYKDELTQAVMNTCVRLIEEKLKDIDDIKKEASNMKAIEARIGEQIKSIDEKYAETRSLAENVRQLNSRIEALSASRGNINTVTRRHDV